MIPPIGLTFSIGSIAAICFVIAAVANIQPSTRGIVAVLGIIIDWIPLLAGWMVVTEARMSLLYFHFVFGIIGYGIVLYYLVGWVRLIERSRWIRIAFISI